MSQENELGFREYQAKARTTAVYPNIKDLFEMMADDNGYQTQTEPIKVHVPEETAFINPYYPALGLAGEVGEFCNKLKKVMRDKGGYVDFDFRADAEKELGDILWYLAECASVLGLDLVQIAKKNLDKLASRKERGVITGSGDNR